MNIPIRFVTLSILSKYQCAFFCYLLLCGVYVFFYSFCTFMTCYSVKFVFIFLYDSGGRQKYFGHAHTNLVPQSAHLISDVTDLNYYSLFISGSNWYTWKRFCPLRGVIFSFSSVICSLTSSVFLPAAIYITK